MTSTQHNALLRRARSMDAWWSAPLSNLAATWTNWFSDRLKKIKPAIKTSRKVLNGPYVHNKLSYVFFPSFSSGHSSYLHWQVTDHANVTVMTGPSCYLVNFGHILEYQRYTGSFSPSCEFKLYLYTRFKQSDWSTTHFNLAGPTKHNQDAMPVHAKFSCY